MALAFQISISPLKWRRELFLGDVIALLEGDDGLDGLSLAQKLYILDIRRFAKSENPVYERNL